MIVVDTSALIAIALAEDDAERCIAAMLATDRRLISAATVTEALIVAYGRDCETAMRNLLHSDRIGVEPVTAERARAAANAYRHYGKGWHAAALNYGDSFSYALAMEHECPLLFIGRDFGLTDVRSALQELR